jgi:hypothetical protein
MYLVHSFLVLIPASCLQEQPPFDKKSFVSYIKKYIKNLTAVLEPEKADEFKKGVEGATKFLLSKLKDLQL